MFIAQLYAANQLMNSTNDISRTARLRLQYTILHKFNIYSAAER